MTFLVQYINIFRIDIVNILLFREFLSEMNILKKFTETNKIIPSHCYLADLVIVSKNLISTAKKIFRSASNTF